MKNKFAPAPFLWIFLLAFLLVTSATAQEVQYRDPADPARGYWQIVTDAETKSTVIQFFDGQKKQIYEETIPGKYIKLTSRNITRINKTFDQIAGKTMVLDQVKADPLTSPAFRRISQRQSKRESQAASESALSNLSSDSRLKVHAYQINRTAKIYLTLQNPDLERIDINLLNKVGRSIFQKSLSTVKYTFKFNFTGIEYGKYKLVVTTAKSKQKYTRSIEIKPPSPFTQENQPELILDGSSELAIRF